MGCDTIAITKDIELDCEDIPIGGLVKVYAARYADVKKHLTETDGVVTNVTGVAKGKIVNLEFNNKDGYSSFTDEKTSDDSGVVKAVPTVVLEFPKMTIAKRNAIEKLTMPNSEYVLFVEAATGVRHAIGMDAGVWGSEANGQSGASKDDKNSYNIKFEGEEINLARTINDAAWAKIVAALK